MNEFKKIIDEDIKKCEEQLKNGNKESWDIWYCTLISKYGKIIDGFKDDLLRLTYDDTGEKRKNNIEIMRQKLVLFKAMGYENSYAQKSSGDITFNNSNHMEATINVNFTEVKKQIENMTSLKDEEIDEIHNKIDELEKIVNSSERKTKKWDMAKNIIKWIADKGVDVGIALLPLIMQIGQ